MAGIRTAGVYDPSRTLPRLGLPQRLDGRTVLDVGAWDGYYSFEMERRGAARVVATDDFCWGGGGWGTQEGFNLARRALGSKVEDQRIDVLDLSPEVVGGPFDVVLFLGVLYHLPNPLLALERVRSVTGGLLVLETEVDLLLVRRPAAAFFPGSELGDDPTNWWAPNVPAVLGMLPRRRLLPRRGGVEAVHGLPRRPVGPQRRAEPVDPAAAHPPAGSVRLPRMDLGPCPAARDVVSGRN